MKRLRQSLIVLVWVYLMPSSFATTYFVATTGNNTNAGTMFSPWASIQQAANVAIAGDTILIREGTYFETVFPQQSGSPNNEIVYTAYPGEEVVIDPIDTTLSGVSIGLPDALSLSYLRFEHLTLKNGGAAGFYARATDGAKHHITLSNMTIENSFAGIYLRDGVHHVSILNCDISLNQYNLYFQDGSEDILIDSCHIHNSIWHLPQAFTSNGIHFARDPEPWGDPHSRITITNNHIHDIFSLGISVYHCSDVIIRNNYLHHNGATAIQLESNPSNPDLSSRIVVEDNICEFNALIYSAETGIWVDDSDDVIVQRNITRGNEIGLYITGSYNVIARFNESYNNNMPNMPDRINSYGIGVAGSPNGREAINNAIVHNTVHNNSLNSQRAQIMIGMWPPPFQALVDSTRFKNNISSESQSNRDIWIEGPTQFMDFNNYFLPGSNSLVWWQGTVMPWNSYLNASGHDEHSQLDNPLFMDVTANDFRLQSTSPCIDAGGHLTFTTAPGAGITIPVDDPTYFSDGMGLIAGDEVQIGSNPVAMIMEVDYETKTLEVNIPLVWEAGDGVSYPYAGSAPDIGAHEFAPATSVETLDQPRPIRIFPNPVDGILTISGFQGKGAVEIVNVTGSVVYQGELRTSKSTIDLSDYPSGFYVIRLKGDASEKLGIHKILKK